MDGALEGDVQRVEQRAVGEREVRWSARRKEGVVMRLLRGESLDLLARESGQPAGRISGWREEFLSAGREGLKARPLAAEDVALREAQRKVGELSMELDIVRALLERKEHPAFPRRLRASFATSSRQSSAYSASRCSPQNRSVIARISPTSPRNAAGTRSSLSPAAMTIPPRSRSTVAANDAASPGRDRATGRCAQGSAFST
jgi:hypothetical protein